MLVGDFLFLCQSVAGTCRQVLPNASGSQLLHLQEMFRCHLSGQPDMQGRFRYVITSYMLRSVLAGLLYLPVNMQKKHENPMDFLGFLFVYYLHVWWIPYLACSEHIVCCTPRPLTIAYGQVWNPTLEHIGSPRLVWRSWPDTPTIEGEKNRLTSLHALKHWPSLSLSRHSMDGTANPALLW